jgi:manganese-dependent inorganic pyrophosphatase
MVRHLFGHKNPDTDAICSSIVYGRYLNSIGIECKVVKLGELNNESKFVAQKFGAQIPETITGFEDGEEVILLDHNEASQSVDNLEDLNIVGIVDHHKFNLNTSCPLLIRSEPVGSTCTIVAKILFENSYEISEEEAGLLISGIISDTLFFRSPTSTSEDEKIMKKLNEISRIDDLERYSLDMFDAKSDLGDIELSDLVKLDYKVYDFRGIKFGIGVLETTNSKFALNKQSEIECELEKIKEEDGLDYVFLSVVDILDEKNFTIYPSDKEEELLKRIFGAQIEDGLANLGSVVSRKKQIVPKIEENI